MQALHGVHSKFPSIGLKQTVFATIYLLNTRTSNPSGVRTSQLVHYLLEACRALAQNQYLSRLVNLLARARPSKGASARHLGREG